MTLPEDLEVARDAALAGRHDVAAALRARHYVATGMQWCQGCESEYDPEWCMCGCRMEDHWSENHSPVEMCACAVRPPRLLPVEFEIPPTRDDQIDEFVYGITWRPDV